MGLTNNRVSVVTGASRGAGKGIAVALGSKGDTVYVTGRTTAADGNPLGSIEATAAAVTEAGGTGIAVQCDHSDDSAVEALFDQVKAEQGHLDILVNNATALPAELAGPGAFWEKSIDMTSLLDVGLRSHYTASYYAAPLLVANGEGLVVITSAPGGRCYMHGPAYGAGKAGGDKLAHDMALDFQPFNVGVVSIWMGILMTDAMSAAAAANPEALAEVVAMAETPEFTGLVIDALANDENYMAKSGQIIYGSEAAIEYGVVDLDGKQPGSHRDWLGAPTEYSDAVVRGLS